MGGALYLCWLHAGDSFPGSYFSTSIGAQVSLVLAENLARPGFRIEENVVTKVRPTDPKGALALTAQAVEQQGRDDTTFTNIGYHNLVRSKAALMVTMDDKGGAKKELDALVKELDAFQGTSVPSMGEKVSISQSGARNV